MKSTGNIKLDDIESMEVPKVKPFKAYGSPMEMVGSFSDKKAYLEAIHKLENELYKIA